MIPLSKPLTDKKEVKAAEEVILSGWLTQGPKVVDLEQAVKDFTGVEYACAVTSCTTALYLSLLALGIGPGSKVATVSHSFIATANSVRYTGADPVFVDIDIDTYNMSAYDLEKTVEVKQVDAVLVVHQMGMPAELDAIFKVCSKRSIPVIEDSACAIGSEVLFGGEWRRVGNPVSKFSCYSFHPRKVVTTGEGGMITTNDESLYRKVLALRQHGVDIDATERHGKKDLVIESYNTLGYNFRMSDIQAAVGVEQMKRLPELIKERRDIDKAYRKYLNAAPRIIPPFEPSYCRSNFQSYPLAILDDNIDQSKLISHLLSKGISAKPGIMNAHEEPTYEQWKNIQLPMSEQARRNTILVPFFNGLAIKDIKYISKTINEYVR